jgi:hypothetical protein
MKKVPILLLLAVAFGQLAAQQNTLSLKLNYSTATPLGGSFKDLVSKTSFAGFGAELSYRISNQFSAGLESGSQVFYEKYPRQVYKTADGSDISAVLSNHVQTVPILLKGQYWFAPDKTIQPFVSLGLGGNIITYNQYAGEFSSDAKSKFGFAARPELGLFVPFRKGTAAGISLSAGYNYMPFKYAGIDNLNSISGRIGISFPLEQ